MGDTTRRYWKLKMSAISLKGDVMGSKGRYFSEGEVKRIQWLLQESEMSVSEIAERMRCSRSAVVSINRKFKIRSYAGQRTKWTVNMAVAEERESFD